MPSPEFQVTYFNQKITYAPGLDGIDVCSSRPPGIASMVESVIRKHDIKDNFKLMIRVADAPWEKPEGGPAPDRSLSEAVPKTAFSFCVYNEMYHMAFPDFIYVGMKEAGMENYTETVNSFIDTVPETNKIGWCGGPQGGHMEGAPRPAFYKIASEHPDFFESRWVTLNLLDWDTWKEYNNYMSYQDQINRWKYLIDMEGCGWSGRLKVLMSSPRIVFMVDRPYQEWYFGYLEPWKHFVPVKRDLSDLIENYNKIESDPELQQYIKTNQKIFAQTYLTRDAAEARIYEIIQDMIQYYKDYPEQF